MNNIVATDRSELLLRTGLDAWADILYTPDESSVILNTFNQCKCVCVFVCVMCFVVFITVH